jgi:alkylation response protein AidB-like acyl-CoA dehydrogenase
MPRPPSNHGTAGVRVPSVADRGVFDLTPTEDEQTLVDVAATFAAEVLRPAAAAADDACSAPAAVLAAAVDLGLPLLGVPESLGGVAAHRSAMAGALVAEALAHGDLGLAVATLAPGSVATALSLWGSDAQQQTHLPALVGADGPAAALALSEPTVLFDALRPATRATRDGDHLVLDGVKTLVPRGAEAVLFVVGAVLGESPVLVLVEGGTPGLSAVDQPTMGVRAAGLTTLTLEGVRVPSSALLGAADGTTYAECVRLSRLAWCALAVGTAQAVLDHVTPYVRERRAFGEPIAHRQSVAFMVADIAIELQAMRLLTYRAASRAARGEDVARDVGLARRLCASRGMKIGLDGVQLLGGHGFVKEHPVERWYRDLRAIGVVEGAVLV